MKDGRWWLRENKFKRVRYVTLLRLYYLFMASKSKKNVAEFMLWLERYIED